MSFRDDWPTNGDGTEYDGKNLLDLVRKDQSPFRGVWDVNQLIAEVEEKLNSKVLDILNVHKGSNNYVSILTTETLVNVHLTSFVGSTLRPIGPSGRSRAIGTR